MNTSDEPRGRGVIFDWTVNLGHILTFVGFIGTGVVAWQVMDKRVTVLETQQVHQQQRDATQDNAQLALRGDIREALRDLQASVEKLNDRLQSVPRSK